MIRNIFFILLISCFFIACSNTNNLSPADQVATEYLTVCSVNNIDKPSQKRLLDTLKNDIQIIEANNNSLIDTAQLTRLIDSAVAVNEKRVAILKTIDEKDSDINLKNLALQYAQLLDSAYNNQFRSCISILVSNDTNKVILMKHLIIPILHKIIELAGNVNDAEIQMKSKYNIEDTDSLGNNLKMTTTPN